MPPHSSSRRGPRLMPAMAGPKPYDPAAFAAAQKAGQSILVHITAPWCPTCKAQKPIVDSLATKPEFKDLAIFDVDFDTGREALIAFKARSQSTMIVFKGEKEHRRALARRYHARRHRSAVEEGALRPTPWISPRSPSPVSLDSFRRCRHACCRCCRSCSARQRPSTGSPRPLLARRRAVVHGARTVRLHHRLCGRVGWGVVPRHRRRVADRRRRDPFRRAAAGAPCRCRRTLERLLSRRASANSRRAARASSFCSVCCSGRCGHLASARRWARPPCSRPKARTWVRSRVTDGRLRSRRWRCRFSSWVCFRVKP